MEQKLVMTQEGLKETAPWKEKGYGLPEFDRDAVRKATMEHPEWVHFGDGNIFKAFLGNSWQNVLNQGKATKGILAIEGFDYELVDRLDRPHDNLTLAVTLKADGTIEKNVVGSIVHSFAMDQDREEEWKELVRIFRDPSLKMASFTITEKGYNLTDAKGKVLPFVEADYLNGPEAATSYIGKVTALLYERFQGGAAPITMASMDNCSHNGTRLFEAVSAYAAQWVVNQFVPRSFGDYVIDPTKVSFPWSMIDKITPRPDPEVKKMLEADGFADTEGIVTGKNTFAAPFVNAEEPQYLVMEDRVPGGRPPLEAMGVMFTDRETVDKVEKMKVCTCLNPLHTALAVFGCLLDYTRIYEEMRDPELVKLVEGLGYQEGLPVVVNPGILNPEAFLKEVLTKRFPNPFMPDTPQRIATDTSQKLGIRYGETIKAYEKAADLKASSLQLIPLVIAGWCRYLMGLDDNGKAFTPSPDPMLEELSPLFAGISLGDHMEGKDLFTSLLANEKIFGVDLWKVGLGEKIQGYFQEMIQGPGAIRAALQRYTA